MNYTTSSGYCGSGALLTLPVDVISNQTVLARMVDFRAHYEFKATISDPSVNTTILVTASYDHSLISTNPDLTIYTKNNYTYVGMDLPAIDVHRRTTEIQNGILYTP